MTTEELAAALERWAPAFDRMMRPGQEHEYAVMLRLAASRLRQLERVRGAAVAVTFPGSHLTTCAVTRALVWGRAADCTCGVDALRAALGEVDRA